MVRERRGEQKNNMIKILELFAGIGACSKAFENLGIPHEIVDAVEIDKYAIKSFNAIHGTDFKPQDIKDWNKNIDVDLIMHGSPCQDFSLAGKNAGGDKDSGTRSSLMYETLRIVEKIKPKYVIWENVKNILSKKHYHNFLNYFDSINKLGYVTFYKVLNAKDYGIPQNRERVFTISILANNKREYEFPRPIPLEKRLKDMLEDNVDEKYYLSDKQVDKLLTSSFNQKKSLKNSPESVVGTLLARDYKDPQCVIISNPNYIKVTNATKKGYDIASDGDSINLQFPNSITRRGRVGHEVSQTLQANSSMGTYQNYRIRKLTPKECWRLMGFDDSDFEKAEKVNSNTQLYKQAGNSIVVNVLEEIIKNLILS